MATTRLPQRFVPAVALLLLACGGGDLVLPADGAPASIQVIEGDGQSGRVGVPLAGPVVGRVTDTQGRPVEQIRVVFTFTDAAGEATVVPDTATTDADGRVSFRVVMGARVGRAGAELHVVGADALIAPVTFTAVSADANELRAVGGDEQRAPAGTVLVEPLVVQVTDAFRNPIEGVPITWSVDGGGSVSAEVTRTGADGLASVTRTLGASAGAQHALASSPGLAGSPVTFTHTASAGAATVLEEVSGNGQSAIIGTALADPLVVRARDGSGNPVAGLAVAWVVGDGGGSLTPATSLTDRDGLASTRWTLGQAPVTNRATAVVSGVGTVAFTADAIPGTPPSLSLETPPPATAVRGVGLSPAPVIQLREPDGSPRLDSGVGVSVAVVEGGAALGGTTLRTTDANGRVEFRDLALLAVPGSYTLAFSASGHTGVTSPAIALVRAPTTTTIRSDDPDPSAAGAPVRVRYRIESVGGTPTGLVRVSSDDGAACSATVAQGECTLTIAGAGARTLTVTYAGDTQFEGSAASTSHGVEAPPQPILALSTQPSPTATSGQPFGRPPVVQLRDGQGADLPTAGVTVTAAIASGTGTLLGAATRTTGADGQAVFSDLGITGAAGSYTVGFTADGFAAVTSDAIVIGAAGPAATSTSITGDDPNPSDLGQAVTVRFAVTSAAGTPTGTVTVAAGDGETCAAAVAAGACSLTLTQPGTRTLTASYAGDGTFAGSAATASHEVRTPPAPPSATTSTVQVERASIELGRGTDVVVTVRDAAGSDMENVAVTLSATGSGNVIDPASATTGKKGEARFQFSSTEAGTKTLTAVAGGVPIAQQPTIVVTPAAPPALALRKQPSDRATSGVPFDRQPELELRAGSGGALAQGGVTVRASVASGGGSLIGATTGVTDGEGRVAFAGLGIAGPPGDYTLRFDADGFTGAVSQTIVLSLASTKTSIVSDAPDPSAVGQPVTVQFQVTSSAGTPTGTVSVSSSTGESCSASVTQGSCDITFTSPGRPTLTASYSGDGSFAASSDDESHTVTAPNAPPSGEADGFAGTEDEDLVVKPRGVLANDRDPDGDPLQALVETAPAHGQLQLAADGGFRYVPTPDFAGDDGFTYRVSDGALSSAPIAVTLSLAPVNDAPSFTPGPNQSAAATAGAQTIPGWATDISPGPSDESGQQVTFEVDVVVGGALFGAAPAVSSDGTLTFTPSGSPGTALVTVRAHDDGGRSGGGNDTSSARTFIIVVTPV